MNSRIRLVAFVVFLLVFMLVCSLALLPSQRPTASAMPPEPPTAASPSSTRETFPGGTPLARQTPPFAVAASLPAFPGAEGFGAYATGGRGGPGLYVTP